MKFAEFLDCVMGKGFQEAKGKSDLPEFIKAMRILKVFHYCWILNILITSLADRLLEYVYSVNNPMLFMLEIIIHWAGMFLILLAIEYCIFCLLIKKEKKVFLQEFRRMP